MKTEFKINVIRNKSITYMLPFLDSELKLEFKHHILNSYLSFKNDDDLFCILYSWSPSQDFLKFEGTLMSNDIFVGHEDYGEKCLYKFRLNNKMFAGREAFINGRYVDFSISHKKFIEDYLNDIKATNMVNIMMILDPLSARGSDKPDMFKETFINHLTVINPKNYQFNKVKK
tara:strand:- start:1251 stop:1769 length:519 start_codon:yes stop_codon:yes gene_type:complete